MVSAFHRIGVLFTVGLCLLAGAEAVTSDDVCFANPPNRVGVMKEKDPKPDPKSCCPGQCCPDSLGVPP